MQEPLAIQARKPCNFTHKIVRSNMAKRDTGVGKRKKVRSPKTKKRLVAKAEMLDALAKKRGYVGKRKPKEQ